MIRVFSLTIHSPTAPSPSRIRIRGDSGEYSYNGGDGINISTRGTINLYGIEANSNAGNGLTIDNCQI